VGRAITAAVAIILATEAGVPVPFPADVVLLGLGERAGAHAVPLWVVMISLELVVIIGTCVLFFMARRLGHRLVQRLTARHPSIGAQIERARQTLDRRGSVGLVAGRATPGLRTVTVLVAALSAIPAGVALAALLVGGSIFVQGHVLLGYAVGPAARTALEGLPVLGIALIALLVVAGSAVWIVRRGRSAGRRGWEEGSCPACLAIGALGLGNREGTER
jgi:membrane protein DedA with SNARE-associated domain